MKGHTNPTVRTTENNETVGPKMHAAVELAASNVYPSMNKLAKAVGPNGSQQYGYRIVKRCIRKGLICRPDNEHDKANPHGRGAIYATEKGKQYLKNNE